MSALVDDTIELKIPSKPEYVAVVRALVADLARRVAFSASAVEDVQVAVSEACANAMCHAYPVPDLNSAEITIRCTTDDERLIMEVADRGQGFPNPTVQHTRNRRRNGGFGLLLIRNLMDHVSLNSAPNQGTIVRMIKRGSSVARS